MSSDQSELRPQLMDESVSPSKPKQKPWQAQEDSRRLNPNCPQSGLLKWDILYPSQLVEPSESSPAAAQLFLSHKVAFEIKHAPTRRFQTKTLISWKVLGPLIVAQDLVCSMCHHKHIFPANAPVKTTGFPRCVPWLSHKEAAHLIRPTPSSSYMSVSNGLLFGANSLQFHRRCCQLFQMCGPQHLLNSVPCAAHDPELHLILRTVKQTMNTHQGT